MRAYSPYLTRLRTQATGLVRGINGDTGLANPQPGELPDFSPAADPGAGVLGLSAVNVRTANNGARGDVVFGSFRQIPDMSAGENRGVLPDKDGTPAFMIVNGLTVQNTDPYSYTGTGGSGEDTRQVITVTVDPTLGGSRPSGATLYTVDKASGHLAEVTTSPVEGGREFSVSVTGGQSELYVWA